MIKLGPILIVLLFSTQACAQVNKSDDQTKKDEFIRQIEKVNALLAHYGTLSPFEDDGSEMMIDSVSTAITAQLLHILNDKRVTNYPIEKLITGKDLLISKSADSKIYFFSVDEKTGGTYRPWRTIIHYRLPDGTARARLFDDDSDTTGTLSVSTYGKVFRLDSAARKYFAIGGVATCGTCIDATAITLQIASDSINTKLIAQYDGRGYDLQTFDYNSELKELDEEYYTEENENTLYDGDDEKSGFRHRYKNKLKYIAGEFIEIEKCEFWDKK